MTCIIIDDEPLAREEMAYLIGKWSDLKITGTFANPLRAMDFLETNSVDLVFLDIEMPMFTGLDFAKSIGDSAMIIFTTAYPQYALKSYELEVVDYLMKPVDSQRLLRAIGKAKRLQQPANEQEKLFEELEETILVRSDRRYHKVQLSQILFIEGLKDYVVIHEKQQQIITAMNLKNIYKELPVDRFLRVSKSYIINLDHVETFDSTSIQLAGHTIPLGAVYRTEFLARYLGPSPAPGEK